MTPEQAFGTVLRELRASVKLSQEKLAFHCGLDRTFISMLERGKRQPSLTSILIIAKAFEITPEELVRRVTRLINL